ncbi:hypothetical protein A3A95_03280 [Candidatus Nomurabacteria bacterium RIFCSPLOWO2_01_FULL_39_18]|uniref:DUF4258 domain-containing protein n=1 Tax=Candidatus Nomurabacteria bacterium RIFCSPHIGHO2_01_FULL_40_24b TaxID=1801739 RepID=A0A1F6V756_9BACT|nr:MAG: hypothetical protein A2647_05115 [Candidatus Nomurabacteria bacterium RIFCSPHIGHO2_01_FULL_40_24b]OGI89109.1 MAG: hypothetical protein A3A95_03280 [Candidatus Nomurabacteria bacterium RIFCSPLOWO2_01_FULL_39_18]
MKLSFTRHARIRIIERNVRISYIKQVLKNPDYKSPTYKNAIRVRGRVGNKVLEIIYKATINRIVIITLYYL